MAAEAFRRDERAELLLVRRRCTSSGNGDPSRSGLGIRERVIFAGVRKDVPDLMRGVMDVFALPSLFEGFGLVGIEAQAAGVPLVYSDTIPDEIEVIPGPRPARLIDSQPAAAWADTLLAPGCRKVGLAEVRPYFESERISLDFSVQRLEEFYEELGKVPVSS